MPKICQADGCTNFVFSKNYCINHQYLRKDEQYLKSLLKKYQKGKAKIKSKSDKRLEQDKEYRKVKEEREAELKAEGKWRCIFCNIPFYDQYLPDWHHLLGRDGDLIINPKYLYPAHTKCHIEDYHQANLDHLKKMFWYDKFLERIKEIDIDLWKKEKRKEGKL